MSLCSTAQPKFGHSLWAFNPFNILGSKFLDYCYFHAFSFIPLWVFGDFNWHTPLWLFVRIKSSGFITIITQEFQNFIFLICLTAIACIASKNAIINVVLFILGFIFKFTPRLITFVWPMTRHYYYLSLFWSAILRPHNNYIFSCVSFECGSKTGFGGLYALNINFYG